MESKEVPILIPFSQDEFWAKIRDLIRTELQRASDSREPVNYETPGLIKKPLFKGHEVCKMLAITRQTLHEWAKEGLLKPYKIKSRVYYLYTDIEALLFTKQLPKQS